MQIEEDAHCTTTSLNCIQFAVYSWKWWRCEENVICESQDSFSWHVDQLDQLCFWPTAKITSLSFWRSTNLIIGNHLFHPQALGHLCVESAHSCHVCIDFLRLAHVLSAWIRLIANSAVCKCECGVALPRTGNLSRVWPRLSVSWTPWVQDMWWW